MLLGCLTSVENRKTFPQIVVGQRRDDMDALFGDRVDELHLVGEQWTAYLVMTAREEVDLQKMVVVTVGYHLILQDSFLRPWHLMVVGVALVLFPVACEPVCERAFGLRRHLVGDRPIGLVHLPFAEHVVQPRQCFGRAGKDDKARHGTVKAMHHPEEHIARFVVLRLDIFLHRLRERTVAGLVALHDLTTLFIDDDDMIIFVKLNVEC